MKPSLIIPVVGLKIPIRSTYDTLDDCMMPARPLNEGGARLALLAVQTITVRLWTFALDFAAGIHNTGG
jgi:hypothetical protein